MHDPTLISLFFLETHLPYREVGIGLTTPENPHFSCNTPKNGIR